MSFLVFLFSCQKAEKPMQDPVSITETETTETTDTTEVADTAEAEDTDETAEPSHNNPWSEEEVDWENQISVVYDGLSVAVGDVLTFSTAPAGIDQVKAVLITITNRSENLLTFDQERSAWLEADGYSWLSEPPAQLAPEESAQLELAFNPVLATEASSYSATLVLPATDIDFSLSISAKVPRPLRMVLVIHTGFFNPLLANVGKDCT